MTDGFDRDVRLHVYRTFADRGTPPSVDETAAALGSSAGDVAAAYRRLADAHAFVLAAGSLDVWLANPFSAVPTAFRVESERGAWWGSCVWDGLAILAMLGIDGTVSTACADCEEPLPLRVTGGRLAPVDGVAHFAVPARRWWDDIGYT